MAAVVHRHSHRYGGSRSVFAAGKQEHMRESADLGLPFKSQAFVAFSSMTDSPRLRVVELPSTDAGRRFPDCLEWLTDGEYW